jgi:hypothetical protein
MSHVTGSLLALQSTTSLKPMTRTSRPDEPQQATPAGYRIPAPTRSDFDRLR